MSSAGESGPWVVDRSHHCGGHGDKTELAGVSIGAVLAAIWCLIRRCAGRRQDAMSVVLTAVALVAVIALVAVGLRMLGRANNERREILGRNIGHRLTLVTLVSKVFTGGTTGQIRALGRRDVIIRVKGKDISLPVAAIQEIWRGDSRLGRW